MNLEPTSKRVLSGESEEIGFPKLVDIDADGDFDVVHFRYENNSLDESCGVYVYKNQGDKINASFENYELLFLTEDLAMPTLVDINSDGDLDMFLIEKNDDLDIFVVNFLENIGNNNTPKFILRESENNPLNSEILESQVASTCFVDIDNDCDLLSVGNS